MRIYKAKILCQDCGNETDAKPNAVRCPECSHKWRNYRTVVRFKKNFANGLCYCGQPRCIESKSFCTGCRAKRIELAPKYLEKKRVNGAQRRLELKLFIIQEYGGACACCGETTREFLEIDHIGGWGTKHRDKTGRRICGQVLFRWLRDNDFPKERFRLLCGSCHAAISYWGYCPHSIQDPLKLPELSS